jgi:hydrogenase/urease accessory protein HupE
MTVVAILRSPRTRRTAAALAATLGAAGTALAHPGHVETPVGGGWLEQIVHLLTEPDHLALLALAVGVALVARRLARRHGARARRDDR